MTFSWSLEGTPWIMFLLEKLRGSMLQLLKPSFTLLRDDNTSCFLIFIRGAISIKDRLTAATGVEVPFHHVVMQEGRVTNVVLGYAHCGMVAAARWIANQAIPILTTALNRFPDYNVKIIGHSMGAGIASILTYVLREKEKFSSSTCIAFAPAACMTWDLAESGTEFITTLVNRTDMVPSFGKVTAANLRKEVSASSWATDLRDQIQRTRFLGFVNRSITFVRSHVPFVSNPKSKVVDVDMLSKASSEAEMKHSSDHRRSSTQSRSSLSCWSCIEKPQNVDIGAADMNGLHDTPHGNTDGGESETAVSETGGNEPASASLEATEPQEPNRSDDEKLNNKEDDAAQLKEMLEAHSEPPEAVAAEDGPHSSSGTLDPARQFYPPGRIMHMVVLPAPEPIPGEEPSNDEIVAIYRTPRQLYSKIRLTRMMIRDHYMPRYIKTMEMLIDTLGKDDSDDDEP